MTRKLNFTLALLIIVVAFDTIAQNQNSWINYNQTYFKLKVAENGMYRISRAELVSAGFPVASIDPRRIQLFSNGVEQAIVVAGQNDGVFDTGDYIEFYGQRNNGVADQGLYLNPADQPHQYHSLFSDSSAYFITWQLTNTSVKRIVKYEEANTTNLPPQQYHRAEELLLFTSQYHEGRSYAPSDEIVISDYDNGEGWTGNAFSLGQSFDVNLTTVLNGVPTVAKPIIEIMFAGRNNNSHNVGISVGASNTTLRTLGTVTWAKDETQIFRSQIEWSDISSDGNLVIRSTASGVNNAADRVSLSYVRLTFPQSFDMGNTKSKVFNIAETTGTRAFINVTNPSSGAQIYDITDPAGISNIGAAGTASSLSAVVQNTTNGRKLLVTSEYKSTGKIKPVNFKIPISGSNYLIISHPSLRSGSGVSSDPIQAYADYRSSPQGGAFKVFQMETEDIYDQFGYGIPTVAAIRNLAQYFLSNGSPQFMFLIGKGISVNFNYYRLNPSSTTLVNLVPTFGYPGADEPFTAGLGGEEYVSALPLGRLNARNAKQVLDYLNKVKEMEALPYNALWRKDIIHLSGGSTVSEQRIFKSYVEEFERVARGEFMGADVLTQLKETTDAVEFFNIAAEVNAGKSLITFFGHSGSFAADIDIGFASDPGFGYNNKGKYPVILVNGCNAGDLYSTVIGFGEDWVHTPNRGAIAFMAHSKQAFSNTLRLYSGLFYETAFASDTYFGTSLGQIRAELARQYFARYGNSGSSISQVEQFVLLGDPAIKLFGASNPDYAIDGLDITASSAEGIPLTGTEDVFYLDIPISNYGKFENDTIEVNVVRTLADGTNQNLGVQKFDPISRNGTIRFSVRNDPEASNAGANMFKVTIDPANKIAELDKFNNIANIDIFIATGATVNLYPANFGIVGSKNVSLIVQATNPMPVARTFTVEVDTTSKFNSGFLRTFSKQGSIIAVFEANLTTIKDSTVIYWRSKIEGSGVTSEPITTSFSYISGVSSGFAIRHEDQYPALLKQKINRNVAAKSWEFVPNAADIKLLTFGAQAPGVSLADIQLLYNGLNFNVNSSPLDPGCRNNTINMVAFNRESTVPYKVIEYNALDVLNSLVCGRVPQIIFNFTAGEIAGGSRHFNSFLNASKTNDNILIFTIGTINFENFDPTIKNALADIGMSSSQIGQLKNGNPFIILGKKGAPAGSARVIVSNNSATPENQQVLTLETEIQGVGSNGNLTSPLIGPAKQWGSFVGNAVSDDIFSVVGVTKDGQEEIIYSADLPKSFNLEFISAERYPNLRIKLQMEDKETFKPTDMKAWQVLYQPVPEGVLFKENISPIVVGNGSNAETEFTYWNVSPTPYIDSLLVNINSRNNTSKELTITKYSLRPLAGGDSAVVRVPLKGIDNIGKSSILMSVLPKSDDERYLPNNRLNLQDFFNVVTDDRNPILDVAFDGVYIMDGDIISPNPRISIQIKDDNPIVQKVDTTGITIQLKKSCSGCDFERIALSDPNVTWQPATTESDFNIEFAPKSLEDGTYGLKVQATDAAGNNAGAQPYQINFQVVNESTITHFYPYPNPFSTSTRFVFTLTGNVIPDELKIQIMTVTGRVVREITQDEIGPIRIGNNISEYAWNGRDEFGDLLANGVYLYRVISKASGQSLDLRATEGDKAFTKGFGKLYILR